MNDLIIKPITTHKHTDLHSSLLRSQDVRSDNENRTVGWERVEAIPTLYHSTAEVLILLRPKVFCGRSRTLALTVSIKGLKKYDVSFFS